MPSGRWYTGPRKVEARSENREPVLENRALERPGRLVTPGILNGGGHRRTDGGRRGFPREHVFVEVHFRCEHNVRHARNKNVVGSWRREAAA
eukprot:6213517-Pleurochrysis_carterae.AAC.2